MTSSAIAYRNLPVDDRQEFRLPALLKNHLQRAAAQTGRSVAEYITAVVAERVTHDLAEAAEWTLTVPEQQTLMHVLAATPAPSARARRTAKRANALFGPLKATRKT